MVYEVQLKREEETVIEIEVDGTKMSMKDGAVLFNSARTCSVISAITDVMQEEGLDWIKVDKK